jgi:hypothetical protein
MFYVTGTQSYGTMIEVFRNGGFAHLYLHAQADDHYQIGYMETRTGSENTVSSVLRDDLRIANSPDWVKMRQQKYGVDPGNMAIYEAPIYTNAFPTLTFRVDDDFKEDDMLSCTFTSLIATEEQLEAYNEAVVDGDDPTLESDGIKSFVAYIRCLNDGNWIPFEKRSANPVVETSVIMVHCDRYVDTETARNFQTIERSNL